MEAAKNMIKSATSSDSQFKSGHKVPISHQEETPGKQHLMPGKQPVNDKLPSSDGGYQTYLAAGKHAGKKALITGGDSGIGRAVAILYAMEGAESTIVYLPEEKDAQETARLVQEKGGKQLHLITADLRSHQACKNVVEKAVGLMGGVNILVLNHATQMMQEKIDDLSEEQWINAFATNIHPFFFLSKYTPPHLSRDDAIIACASVNPHVGQPDLLDYTSTQGAIGAFTRGLSNQRVRNGIRENAVWTPLVPATMNAKAQDDFTSPVGKAGSAAGGGYLLCVLGRPG